MSSNEQKLVIYDLGANVGDDLAYYLLKADLVVAVEANPRLCDIIRERYSADIAIGRLVVENCVLVAGNGGDTVKFYINRRSHLASRVVRPSNNHENDSDPALYDEVDLPSIGIADLIQRHGKPYYLKSDLEYYDGEILRALFSNDIFPPLLSVEAHSVDIFSILVAIGGYDCFKLVEGSKVGFKFSNHPISTRDGPRRFAFPDHAAGPFGDDIPGVWRDGASFLRQLASPRMGWKDIHASRIHTPIIRETLIDYVIREYTPPRIAGVARFVLRTAHKAIARRKKWPVYETNLDAPSRT